MNKKKIILRNTVVLKRLVQLEDKANRSYLQNTNFQEILEMLDKKEIKEYKKLHFEMFGVKL